ncbi:MAG: aldehyde dehydrogenase family protein, partial [Calditrichaeota bacterium]|nr:aldehyde dehydrogenase family protein [Calditrichota bacterium]
MDFLKTLGIQKKNFGASTGRRWLETTDVGESVITSPATGETIASVYKASKADYETVLQASVDAFEKWRRVPAPKRGEIVRQIGDKLREYKEPLGTLVSYEMG